MFTFCSRGAWAAGG